MPFALRGSDTMLKSCKYCGRIHDKRKRCGSSPVGMKKRTGKDEFRSTYEWQKKRDEIRKRDHHLCQLCIRGLHGAARRYVYDNTSVHHIIPLEEDESKRLDDNNLLTLCEYHHKMADRGEIAKSELRAIARAQNTPRRGEG